MKKLILAVAVLLFTGVAFGQKKNSIEKKKEAIMKVIQEEIDAYDARDYDRLAKTFVQDETFTRIQASKNNFYYYAGWEEIGPMYKNYLEKNPEPNTKTRIKSNYRVKVYKESAWVTYVEKKEQSEQEELKVIFLEKVKSEWKIVSLIIFNKSSYEEETEEEKK